MYTEKFSDNRKAEITSKEPDGELLGQPLWRVDAGKSITAEGIVISEAMKKSIGLTYYRRGMQQEYNEKHGITPTTVYSSIKDIGIPKKKTGIDITDKKSAEKEIKRLELEMDVAAANMEYELAAELRDQIIELKK